MNVVAAIPEVAVEAIDPKLVFLERASARLLLVQSGLMDLDEAFDGLVAGLQCTCAREIVERWERSDASRLKRRRQ